MRPPALLRTLLGLAALLLLGAFDKRWKPFRNTTARFQIMMPGSPSVQTSTEDTPAGPVPLYQASLIAGPKAYFVGYSDLPPAAWNGTPSRMLASARDGAARRVGGRVVADRALALTGRHPGREFTVAVGDRMALTQRVYLVGHRLYQANIGCVVGACTTDEVQAFLGSFRLLDGAR